MSELDDALEDPTIFRRDMYRMQDTMWRYMKLWWCFLPTTLFAPAWNAVATTPLKEGKWIGFAIVAGIAFPFWIAFGVLGKRLRAVINEGREQDEEIDRARAAKRKILEARAARMQRAEVRLARIKAAREDEERQAIVEDLERLHDELDDPE